MPGCNLLPAWGRMPGAAVFLSLRRRQLPPICPSTASVFICRLHFLLNASFYVCAAPHLSHHLQPIHASHPLGFQVPVPQFSVCCASHVSFHVLLSANRWCQLTTNQSNASTLTLAVPQYPLPRLPLPLSICHVSVNHTLPRGSCITMYRFQSVGLGR